MARRQKGQGYVSERPDSSGRYRGHITIDGVRHESKSADRAVVVAEIAALAQRVAEGRTPPPKDLTLAEFLDQWLAQRQVMGRLRASTVASVYEPLIALHIVPTLGAIRLSRLAPRDLERLYRTLATAKRQVMRGTKTVTLPPLSPQTVLNVHRLLHTALKLAERQGAVLRNPADAVEPPVVHRKAPKELDTAHVVAILRAAAGTDHEALILLAVATGLRQSELLRLTRGDIDLERRRLVVRSRVRRIPGLGFVTDAPKTLAGQRVLALPALVIAPLRELLARQDTRQPRRGRGGSGVPGLLFPNQAGNYLEPQNWLVRVWRPLLRAAGVDERTQFRDLTRKAQASIMVGMGVDPEALRRRMGHADISTTFRHYTLTVTGADEIAAEGYDRALRRLLSDTA